MWYQKLYLVYKVEVVCVCAVQVCVCAQVRACVESRAVVCSVMAMLRSLSMRYTLSEDLRIVLLWLPQAVMTALRGVSTH